MKTLFIMNRSAFLMFALVLGSASPACADEAQTARLLEAATTCTGQAQYTAIDDLGERAADPEKTVPELIKLVDSGDPQVEWRAVRALGDYGDEAISAAPKLRELLTKSDDPVMQYHAAISLGKIGDRSNETTNALVNAVGSSDGRVSRAAVAALKNLRPGPEKVVAALKKAMVAQDEVVASQALEAIVELGDKAVPLLNEALKSPETAYLAASAAEQIGPDAAGTVPALLEVLQKTKHSQLQIRLLLALGRIGPASSPAVPRIVELLETSSDATVPVAAAFALGAIGAAEGDAPLRAAVTKNDEFLSMVAAWSLAKLHPEDAQLKQQAQEKIDAGLKSSNPAVKAAAAKAAESTAVEAPAAK